MKHLVRIDKRTGTIAFLGAPPPRLELAAPVRRRFSEILPTWTPLRLAFRAMRARFGEEGRVAAFTRRWPCQWEAVILLGPSRGTRRRSWDREFLLHWERQMFLQHGAT